MLLHREAEAATPAVAASRAVWPDAVAYREAVQDPRASILVPGLADAEVIADRRGLPVAYTGRFAVVFRLRDRGEPGGEWALRCFTSPAEEEGRRRRYEAVARHLSGLPDDLASSFVSFRYLTAGVRVAGQGYPALAMRWARGETLGRFVERHAASEPAALLRLCAALDSLLRRMEAAGMAHGDWQHDNLLVSDGGRHVTLVDYDGLWVPELAGEPASEAGHPNYQHPRRAASGQSGPGRDRFSYLVMQAGLLAVAHEPSLWGAFAADGESLLFKASDLAAPAASPVFDAVRLVGREHPAVAEALEALERACAADPEELRQGPFLGSVAARLPAHPAPARPRATAAAVGGAAAWYASETADVAAMAAESAVGASEESASRLAGEGAALAEAAARRSGRARRAFAEQRRARRGHLAVVRLAYALILAAVCFVSFTGTEGPAVTLLLLGALALTLLGYAAWPRRRAAGLVTRLAEENRAAYYPVKSRLQRRRLALKRLNDASANRSAVAYVAEVLRGASIRGVSDGLGLPARDRDRLLLTGIETMADLPGELKGIAAAVSAEGRGRLYQYRSELVQSAREGYEAVSDGRRRLQREIDALGRAAEGLQDAEDELDRYARDLGDTRLRAFLAEVLS